LAEKCFGGSGVVTALAKTSKTGERTAEFWIVWINRSWFGGACRLVACVLRRNGCASVVLRECVFCCVPGKPFF
jgi:hypothetical protein